MKKKILKAAVLCAAAAMMTAGAAMTAMAESGTVTHGPSISSISGYGLETPAQKWKIGDGDWTDVVTIYDITTTYYKDLDNQTSSSMLWQDSTYQYKDGTPVNGWLWLDNGRDCVAECYYFDHGTKHGSRYGEGAGDSSATYTTPDGYEVDAYGKWIVDGVVQERTVEYSVDADPEAVKLLSEYDEEGHNLGLMDMMGKTREQNKKYGEIAVDDDLAATNNSTEFYVRYQNGVKCDYSAYLTWRAEYAAKPTDNGFDWMSTNKAKIDITPFQNEYSQVCKDTEATWPEEMRQNMFLRRLPYPYESKLDF